MGKTSGEQQSPSLRLPGVCHRSPSDARLNKRNIPGPPNVCKSPDTGGLTMIGILILSFSILLCGALPWWPYSAYGRLRHHRPWNWLMDSGGVTGETGVSRHNPHRGKSREMSATRYAAPARSVPSGNTKPPLDERTCPATSSL